MNSLPPTPPSPTAPSPPGGSELAPGLGAPAASEERPRDRSDSPPESPELVRARTDAYRARTEWQAVWLPYAWKVARALGWLVLLALL